MIVTFLGTGTSQGVPVIASQCAVCRSADPKDQRLRSALMLETGNKRFVIDCGPDFRQQMLREKILAVDAILITHGHKDHLGGLDDVRAFNYILKNPVDVYASDEVQKIIRHEFEYAFRENKYPGVPEINLHLISNQPFFIENQEIIPIKARHFAEQFVYGFRIGDLTYITDAVEIEEGEKRKIAGSRVIVINALRNSRHVSHFSVPEAVAILEEFKPEAGFLTHLSHFVGLHEEVNKKLPDYIQLAYDGLEITI